MLNGSHGILLPLYRSRYLVVPWLPFRVWIVNVEDPWVKYRVATAPINPSLTGHYRLSVLVSIIRFLLGEINGRPRSPSSVTLTSYHVGSSRIDQPSYQTLQLGFYVMLVTRTLPNELLRHFNCLQQCMPCSASCVGAPIIIVVVALDWRARNSLMSVALVRTHLFRWIRLFP